MIAQVGVDLGIVTRRDDPEERGRVKVRIPGVVEPETPEWVEELGGSSGGGAQRGTIDPPAVGSTVGVLSHRGDVDRLFFLRGPYGAPGGTTDAPEGGAVEGDDRGLVATEDAEWLIQRDSQTASIVKRYRVKHKASGAEVVIESDDNVRLAREAAAQAFVRGTEYRTAEAAALSTLATNLSAAGVALNSAGVDVALVAAAPLAAGFLVTAGTALSTASTDLNGAAISADATAYLSSKIWGD